MEFLVYADRVQSTAKRYACDLHIHDARRLWIVRVAAVEVPS